MLVKSQIKYIQSLSQKKCRDEGDIFVAEGPRLVNELLELGNVKPVEVFAIEEWKREAEALLQTHPQLPVTIVSDAELEKISMQQSPNRVLALFRKPVFPSSLPPGQTCTLMLDTIQDPGNLGSIVRSADWFGITQIVCSTDSADLFNPKVVQATMGSICRVQVIYTDLEQWLQRQAGIPIYAATLDGEDFRRIKPIREGIIVVGNEAKGIRTSILTMAHHRIKIPGKGRAESLNAAVATGILLSHLCLENHE